MSETGLLCTLYTLTFLNIALKMIKHLPDEVEKEGKGTQDFFTPKGFVQSSIKGNSQDPFHLQPRLLLPVIWHSPLASS